MCEVNEVAIKLYLENSGYILVFWHARWSSRRFLLWNICNQRFSSQDH
jgi:hypothetical protein